MKAADLGLAASLMASAAREVTRIVDRHVPRRAASDGLAAFVRAACRTIPESSGASVLYVAACAWPGSTIKPAALSNRFRYVALAPPSTYVRAIRGSVAAHCLTFGVLPSQVAAAWSVDSDHVTRLLQAMAGYRLETTMLMREPPLWAARRFLAPLLRAVPREVWRWHNLLRRD
jgi:hypothetical protein